MSTSPCLDILVSVLLTKQWMFIPRLGRKCFSTSIPVLFFAFSSCFRYLSEMLGHDAVISPMGTVNTGTHYIGVVCKRNVFLDFKSKIPWDSDGIIFEGFNLFCMPPFYWFFHVVEWRDISFLVIHPCRA